MRAMYRDTGVACVERAVGDLFDEVGQLEVCLLVVL
jgi:hypothetical protein